jgi:hypothetical protein
MTAGSAGVQGDSGLDAASDAGKGDATSADTVEGGGGGFPPDCTNAPVAKWIENIYPTVIVPWCGMKCHNANDATGGGLDLYPLDQARAWRNLVTQDPKQSYMCYQKGKRVVPGNPEMSIVYSKLIDKPICGHAEPQGTPAGMLYPSTRTFVPLPNDQICMFYTWIKAGALDN